MSLQLVPSTTGTWWEQDPVADAPAAAPASGGDWWKADPVAPAPKHGIGEGFSAALLAGAQGTSPVVQPLTGGPNYQRVGDLLELDQGYAYKDQQGNVGNVDRAQHVILPDPQSGKLAVFQRNPEMAESGAAGLGRVLGFGAMAGPVSGAPATVAKSAQRLADYERVGVSPSLPGVAGGPGTNLATKVIEAVPGAGIPVQKGIATRTEQLTNAVEDIAGKFGGADTPEQAGRALQQGIEGFADTRRAVPSSEDLVRLPSRMGSVSAKASTLYDRIPVSGDVPVDLNKTREALQGISAKFQSNPEFGKTLQDPKFSNWLGKLGEGNLTWDELKQFRTYVGERLGDRGLTSGIAEADLRRLYGGLSDDMRAAAESAGGLRAFEQANDYWRASQGRLERLNKLWGAEAPEQAYQRAMSAAKAKGGDIGLLRAAQRSLKPDEWNEFASGVVRQMGRTVGEEGATSFSPMKFVGEYGRMSDEAKDLLFRSTGNADLKKTWDSLARVAEREAGLQKQTNWSKSGTYAMVGGLGAGLATAPVSTILTYLGATGTGAALMSPTLARWVAQASMFRTPPQMASHVARLETIARQAPEVAPLVQRIREGLMEALAPIQMAPADEDKR